MATAQNEPNRQRIHLAEPKRCLDEAGHRSRYGPGLRLRGVGQINMIEPNADQDTPNSEPVA